MKKMNTRKLKKFSPTVLSCAGAVGVVGTSVLAVKATPKALRKIRADSRNAHNDPDAYTKLEALSNAGTEHRKYMRMMPVYVRITAPLYWWKEFDTYKVGTVANSCSTMHKIAEKEFTLEDFSTEHICIRQSMDVLKETIDTLNVFRDVYLNGGILRYENGNIKCFGKKDKEIWWQMIQLLPSSYNQTRNVMLNYEVLANIYRQRKHHKLDEWREFCKWIESLPYSELIVGGEEIKYYADNREVKDEQN